MTLRQRKKPVFSGYVFSCVLLSSMTVQERRLARNRKNSHAGKGFCYSLLSSLARVRGNKCTACTASPSTRLWFTTCHGRGRQSNCFTLILRSRGSYRSASLPTRDVPAKALWFPTAYLCATRPFPPLPLLAGRWLGSLGRTTVLSSRCNILTIWHDVFEGIMQFSDQFSLFNSSLLRKLYFIIKTTNQSRQPRKQMCFKILPYFIEMNRNIKLFQFDWHAVQKVKRLD